jgi:hypothetical protein
LSRRSGPRGRAPGAPEDTTRTLARSKFSSSHLELHKLEVVAIDGHGRHELAGVPTEPHITEAMVCRERLDQLCSPVERLIVSQPQIHTRIIPDL